MLVRDEIGWRGRKLNAAQKELCYWRRLAGHDLSAIAADLAVSASLVGTASRERGFRTHSRRGPRKPLNEAAFSLLTPEAAYWVGFLMADGCIVRKRLQVEVAAKDRPHLAALRAFLGAGHAIRDKVARFNVPTCVFAVTSSQILSDLARYGVVPRKSGTAQCSAALELSPDFWRGVVDGDGCLTWNTDRAGRRNPALHLCGSRQLMEQFALFVDLHTAGRRAKVRRAKGRALYVFALGHQRTRDIARVLYDGATIALERKRALAVAMYSP